MGAKTVERFFSLADNNFIDDVNDDIRCYLVRKNADSVLIFPPVSNYRRFLIHKCVEDSESSVLATFSIGVGDERRTIVCFKELLLSDVACAKPSTMGLSQTDRDNTELTRNGPVGECKRPARAQLQEKIRSASSKPKRPDRAVYVPRALRNAENPNAEEKPPDTRKRSNQSAATPNAKCPKAPRDKSQPETPRKSTDKNFCNVYTPPHLRNQRSQTAPSIGDDNSTDSVTSVPISNSAIKCSDNSYKDVKVGETFYIGDYFAHGQLGFYNPDTYYSDYTSDYPISNFDNDRLDCCVYPTEEYANELNMSVPDAIQSNIIDNGYSLTYDKDEDVEKNELRRASQEINRSNKRIIKQSFHSDVLVISDPVDEPKADLEEENRDVSVEVSPMKEKKKLEAKLSLKREENDWESVFDESGECLDPSLLEELTATVGKVRISKTKNNYDQYQSRGQALFNGPFDETFAHVVEVYDFPSEFKTNDLLATFSEYKDTGFEIKWVDDTHALIVFSAAKIAAEVLSTQRPLVKCRPLHAATSESRNKAKKCAEFLQPYRQRPETCTALARRLVSGALGVKLSTARQERAEERRLITLAREKKRQAALHKEAAWDGSLGNEPLGDT